ncbi:glycosyltransferase family 2 protein [Parvularcula maris]|uniref:Glycosyltransferase family 2 protein n=1 Tax=Parvularcula maris TaxID=2965077 RepID=A0A9X2RL74_9PROT|nr:glycosyltransferase [Parvularcula maris]MCQ8186317.1 glycosyltransferase family 2 protein [Parvularcula maris]
MTSPVFSIIVPTYNRPKQIADCIAHLRGLAGPPFEIIVVDDGSPEPVGGPIGSESPVPVRIIRQENQGPGAARNRGAKEAAGTFLAFTDDDCRPVSGWLEAFYRVLSERGDVLAGGPVINALTSNPYAAASQDIITFLYETDNTDTAFFTSNNFACRKDVFESVGGFDESLRIASEDRDFCIRCRVAGIETVRVPEASIEHFHDLSLRSFWRQHFRYGIGARQLSDKLNAGQPGSGLSVRRPDFYARLLTHPLRSGGKHRLGRSLLIALSHIAMAFGFRSAAPRPSRPRSASSP